MLNEFMESKDGEGFIDDVMGVWLLEVREWRE